VNSNNACSKKNWSSGLVLDFVSINAWRSIIGFQMFCKTGSVEWKSGSGGSSIRISETVERIREIK
jgi:hypothetical protein